MRAQAMLLTAVLALPGCAKFANNGAANFTRIHFDFTLAAPVVTENEYAYVVAIRPLFAGDSDTTHGPIPVTAPGTKNGFVGGRPTLFIRYEADEKRYEAFRFNSAASTDPDDPGPQGEPIGVATAEIDPIVVDGVNGKKLGFDIDTRYLVADRTQIPSIQSIQFNILTMNKVVLNSGNVSGRVVDAIGDQKTVSGPNFYAPYLVSIITSGHYGPNRNGTLPEEEGDTYGGQLPSVDIVDWNVDVFTP